MNMLIFMLLDDKFESAQAKADFFELRSVLSSVANGASASEVMAPLKGVMDALEALTAVHPFIAVAVLPFKAIIKLELNRRANDRRILTLIGQMADMMQHLKELPREQLQESQTMLFDEILANMKVRALFQS